MNLNVAEDSKPKEDNLIDPRWFQLPSYLLVERPIQKLKRRMVTREKVSGQVSVSLM